MKLTLTHIFEVYVFDFKGTEYEVKVDATGGKRCIVETFNFSLSDEVSDEVYEFINEEIVKIDNTK